MLLSSIRAILSFAFRGQQIESEIQEELRAHLMARAGDLEKRGLSRAEAERQARIEFGGYQRYKEECREALGTRFIGEVIGDVHYGVRQLRRNPGFTAVAVLTLALGIGACTALFSVVNGVLLNPLPYPNPDHLVAVDASKANFRHGSISYPNFLDWHRINQCFSSFAVSRATGYLLTGVGAAEELNAAAITSDFFPMLGIKPVLGRGFTPNEDQIGISHVVAISTDLWQQKFGGSPRVIGKEISLDGKGYTVIGVFPGHLDLPMGYFSSVDVYVPLGEFANPAVSNRLAGLGIHGIARLKPGVSLQQARADMQRVTTYLAKIYPEADEGMGATLTPLKDSIVGNVRGFLLLLLGAVGFVLLIACVNIANILLARGNARGREIAVRSALGAGTGRLVRQMLTESVLLAVLGGSTGLAVAALGTRAALAVLPATLPRVGEVGIDRHVLWFTIIVSLGAGILFGILPAIRAARQSPHETLKEGARGSAGGWRRHRAQGFLVTVQMALAVLLLAGAGLLIRSLSQLWKTNPGFNPDHILTFNLALPPQMNHAHPAAIRAALRNFDAAISAVPGVEAESLSWGAFPMYSEDDQNFWISGQPRPANENQMYGMLDYIVGPEYLKAMRIPLLAGRFFNAGDNEHSKPVVVVDQVLARKYFHGNAIGKAICQGDQSHTFCFDIVGIVGHVAQWGLDTDAENSLRAQVYFPFMQMPENVISLVPSNTSVVVRSARDVASLVDSIRRASNRLDRNEVLTSFATMHGIIQSFLAPRRFAMMLLGAFAALALFLAGIGLYGVIAYAAGQRTHEIGIRIALGARPHAVFRLVIGQGIYLALIGVAVGMAASLIVTRVLPSFSQLVYGISKSDPLTLVAVSIVLLAAAVLASYIPARRAAKVDPMEALRCE